MVQRRLFYLAGPNPIGFILLIKLNPLRIIQFFYVRKKLSCRIKGRPQTKALNIKTANESFLIYMQNACMVYAAVYRIQPTIQPTSIYKFLCSR